MFMIHTVMRTGSDFTGISVCAALVLSPKFAVRYAC